MQDHDNQPGYDKRREAWRAAREAKRVAWRVRRAAQRARWMQGWEHMGDPKFWGLDPETMRANGMSGMHGTGFGAQPSSEVAELKAKVADMEKIIASLSQRVIVLEKLAVNDDARLAAEIEKLRDIDTGTK